MRLSDRTAPLILAALIATPAPAWAFTGPGGCNGLPEYYRALGTLQGNMESACAMTVAQARSIVAAYGGPLPEQQVVRAPRAHAHRYRTQP